ncbi:uncharacterized protein A1O5_10628 [Cladophialophora psammophila CBS 110553]|uniref:Cytochrome P450 monooxygenase n=1 Tax=Cladophialophora psammophila CBS 110553 TaxID=1182543 RepID=W9WP97_9EURO|nr:uncharacterized protein A1O5_10628 [Cladophialophora psammophila CBS 110553]EXJ66476.1 hypothetical protein A1O5_10628 [Cladophialophora psammophila CBS 110553]
MEYCHRPRELMWKGYTQYPDQIWGLDTNDGLKVVLPPRFLDELKSHPDLSFKVSIDSDMQIEYTRFGGPPEYVINTIKGSLNISLPAFTPVIHKIVRDNLERVIGDYPDWTPVKVHDRILKLVGTSNARVFHSAAVSQSEEWVDAATGYVITTFDCIKALKAWPPYLRPFVYRFLPERAAILDQWRRARPFVEASVRQKQKMNNAFLESPGSMLDHLCAVQNGAFSRDIDKQLLFQMTLVAVGTVTTFASITQALYDLAYRPEYIAALREEVESAPREANQLFSRTSLAHMKKLDSFIKESQRLSAPDLTTFQRAATADVTLSDGTVIPTGTRLEIATSAIHLDEKNYEHPNQFDGLRFYRARLEPGAENRHLYVSVGKNDLSFGYGRHACPGRFLGHINIKLIMAEILLNYDFKLPDGAERPKNGEFEAIVSPDPEIEIFMKNRWPDEA